jgi:hypothetical protein
MEHDEFHGIGGQYIADPKTGKRKLVQRTEEKAEPVVSAEVQDEQIEADE